MKYIIAKTKVSTSFRFNYFIVRLKSKEKVKNQQLEDMTSL